MFFKAPSNTISAIYRITFTCASAISFSLTQSTRRVWEMAAKQEACTSGAAGRALFLARLGAFLVGIGLSNQHAVVFYALPIIGYCFVIDTSTLRQVRFDQSKIRALRFDQSNIRACGAEI